MFTNCKSKEELVSKIETIDGMTVNDVSLYSMEYKLFFPKEFLLLLVDLILVYGYSLSHAPVQSGFREAVQKLDPYSCKYNSKWISMKQSESGIFTCDGALWFALRRMCGDNCIHTFVSRKISVYPLLAVTDEGEPIFGDIVKALSRELRVIIQETLYGFGYKDAKSGNVKIFGEYISVSNLKASIRLFKESDWENRRYRFLPDSEFSFVEHFILGGDMLAIHTSEEQVAQTRKNLKREFQRIESSLSLYEERGYPGLFITPLGIVPMLPEFM